MKSNDQYLVNTITWNLLADVYEQKFMDLDLYNETYLKFSQLIEKEKAAVLEIGCGPGNICRYLRSIRSGLKFLETDVSPNMLELSKKNNPGEEFMILDARSISELKRKFDGIICGFCIPYLDKKAVSDLIEQSGELLNTGGILYLSAIEGNYDSSGEERSSDGSHSLFVHYYEFDFLSMEMERLGFKVREYIKIPYKKSNELIEQHMIFLAEKTVE